MSDGFLYLIIQLLRGQFLLAVYHIGFLSTTVLDSKRFRFDSEKNEKLSLLLLSSISKGRQQYFYFIM